MSSQATKTVILGAGYAGLMAALRLAGKTGQRQAEVILINGSDTFVQRPRLHHVATGQEVPQEPLAELLKRSRARLLSGWVTAVDPQARMVSVKTESGAEEVAYDFLVYALGSRVDQDSVPGVREHAYVLNPGGANGARALLAALQALPERGGRVIVAGGGKSRGAATRP